MATDRIYKGKDSEMLIACSTILQAAIANQPFLVTKRATWTTTFFSNLETRINTAISTYLGVDNAALLRSKTSAVTALQETAYAAVSDVKLQLETDYKKDKLRLQEILTTLGYNQYWLATRAKDQEALISLLFSFKQNLSSDLRTELVSKGISATYLDTIVNAAQDLLDANVNQEFVKQSKKVQTEAAILEFNAIYDEVIGIAELSRRFFKGTANEDQFSYSKILKTLNTGAITTLYDDIIIIQPGSNHTVNQVKLTSRSKVTLTLLYDMDGVYACRNTNGCYPSDSQKLQFEVPIECTKAQLNGTGNYLIIANPQSENAKVQIKIQG